MISSDQRRPTRTKKRRSHDASNEACKGSLRQSLFFAAVLCSLCMPQFAVAFSTPPISEQSNHLPSLKSSYIDEPRTWDLHRNINNNDPPNDNMSDDRSKSRQKMKPMPITGYDYKSIEEYYDRRPLQVGWRLNSLSLPLLGSYFQVFIYEFIGSLMIMVLTFCYSFAILRLVHGFTRGRGHGVIGQ
jgi:hypothetical protein